MLEELQTLLDALPTNATRADYVPGQIAGFTQALEQHLHKKIVIGVTPTP